MRAEDTAFRAQLVQGIFTPPTCAPSLIAALHLDYNSAAHAVSHGDRRGYLEQRRLGPINNICLHNDFRSLLGCWRIGLPTEVG